MRPAWKQDMPVYVTNEAASGAIGTFSINVWVAFLLYMLVLVNALGWSVVGLIELVKYVLNAL